MNCIDRAFAAARRLRGRIVMPEMEDARIAAAAARLRSEKLAEPLDLAAARPARAYLEVMERTRPGLKPALALRLLEKPLFRAAAMVAAGEADMLLAGAAAPTRRVIEAAAMTIGMADGVATPSSFFLMLFPDGRELILSDCAVNVEPGVNEICDIARASMRSAEILLGTARLALLSFSTGASGAGSTVDMMRTAQARLAADGVAALGPVQADAALNPDIAARKGLGVVEPANVLLFPGLDAGNIAYKLLQELGGAQAVGPLLQGFARPVCDLSRGASIDDIVLAAAFGMATASAAHGTC